MHLDPGKLEPLFRFRRRRLMNRGCHPGFFLTSPILGYYITDIRMETVVLWILFTCQHSLEQINEELFSERYLAWAEG